MKQALSGTAGCLLCVQVYSVPVGAGLLVTYADGSQACLHVSVANTKQSHAGVPIQLSETSGLDMGNDVCTRLGHECAQQCVQAHACVCVCVCVCV